MRRRVNRSRDAGRPRPDDDISERLVICVCAGNRVDATSASTPRFPAKNTPWVQQRLERLLSAVAPSAVVAAAAAGADLLVHETAARLGLPSHVVLPFAVEAFLERSVADRGPEWAARFQRLLELTPRERLHVGQREPDSGDVFVRGNTDLLTVAEQIAAGEEALAIAVRPPPDPQSGSVTDDFVAQAQSRQLVVIDLDPTLLAATMRSAFVVMPYGTKADRDGRLVDCEATFNKLVVPALEDADLDWFRADREVDAGIIHVGMIDRLARSDVVVVDTTTENANVFYELGLRHAMAKQSTVLIGPHDRRLPFNVTMLRKFPYRLSGSTLSDADALQGVDKLRPILTRSAGGAGVDSPVFQLFDGEPPVLHPRDQAADVLLELHRRIDTATGLDEAALTALVSDVERAQVTPSQRRELVVRAAVLLREERRYAMSLTLLENYPVPEQDRLLYGYWAQQLAMTQRRIGEQAAANSEDPEPWWQAADRLLQAAMDRLGDDPETCGIAGGLAKRRALRRLRMPDAQVEVARALAGGELAQALDLYRRGFRKRPSDFYTGVNVVTVGGLLARLGLPIGDLDLHVVTAVTHFYLNEAASTGFWNLITRAELALNACLSRPDAEQRVLALQAYARALAFPHPQDHENSALDQLDLVRLMDPESTGVVADISSLFGARP
ncbi:MAG TPA: tetratricopeptide repeat-containing protein [Propionibacteriaceae bacterium]|nr:tetratricopeptide repeat-containing protein [Propionibacteriaceae bacterium]